MSHGILKGNGFKVKQNFHCFIKDILMWNWHPPPSSAHNDEDCNDYLYTWRHCVASCEGASNFTHPCLRVYSISANVSTVKIANNLSALFCCHGVSWKMLRSPRFHGSLWEQLADSISGQCSWEPAHTNVSPLRLLNWIQLRGLLTPKAIFLEAGTCYFLAQLCCIFPSERKVGNPKKKNISENSNSRPVWNCSFCCLITIIMSINMLILDWLSSSFKMKVITKRT